MTKLLDNPVYHALLTGDSIRSLGNSSVKYFDPEVSPFVGFDVGNEQGFEELHALMPKGRKILYAKREKIEIPKGWSQFLHLEGLQFLFTRTATPINGENSLIPLEPKHVPEMVALAKLTKPGPFDNRTIEFGYYYGVFENDRLAAMSGQRLHPENYSEISAVCTHPDFQGRGYAKELFNFQVNLILEQGQIPFLHVRADNERAIDLYEKNGFTKNGPMQFYFLKRC